MASDFKNFTDFLKMKSFVRWQINPDDELHEEWTKYEEDNPHLKEELNKAKLYLKNTILNQSMLSQTEKQNLLDRIELDISKKRKKRRMIISTISAVAAVVLLVISIKVFDLQQNIKPVSQQEVIIGNMLNDIDIQLVTSNHTESFTSDLDLEFDKEGNATASQKNSADKRSVQAGKHETSRLIVPYGKRSTITLADGSKIWLNSGSVLEFPTTFDNNPSRLINLHSGELYIEVAKDTDKPFIVKTSKMDVRVYGTKFNVTAYANEPQAVVLVEGKVGVESESGLTAMLKPSEQVVLTDHNTLETQIVDVQKYTSWKNGYLILEKTPLPEILYQVERYYNLSINLGHTNELKNVTCDGKLILSDDINNVMSTIAFLANATYQRTDDKVHIIKKEK